MLLETLDQTINFAFFWPNNFVVAHGISMKFGLWVFHELWKIQKNFDFTDFWLS